MLYLASTSVRRRRLLAQAGIVFELHAPGPEPDGDGSPRQRAVSRARAKAVGARLPPKAGLVLGVDTVVDLDGQEFGKPRGRHDAAAMISRLAGRQHEVHTAHCLYDPVSGSSWEELRTAGVCFAPLETEQIEQYIEAGGWQDKAGAYGIQDTARSFARLTSGELDTVIGLSLEAVRMLLACAGAQPKDPA